MNVQFLLDRLKEPSTWKGLTVVLTGLGIGISPDQAAAVASVGAAAFGLIEVFRKEGGDREANGFGDAGIPSDVARSNNPGGSGPG